MRTSAACSFSGAPLVGAARRAARIGRAVVVGLAFAFAVVFLPSAVWAADETTSPEPTSEPSPVEPTPTEPPPAEPEPVEPTPTVTETVTETAEPEPVEPPPAAPGQGTGVYVDPSTGSLRVNENVAVAIGVGAWLLSVVGGLATARLVLP